MLTGGQLTIKSDRNRDNTGDTVADGTPLTPTGMEFQFHAEVGDLLVWNASISATSSGGGAIMATALLSIDPSGNQDDLQAHGTEASDASDRVSCAMARSLIIDEAGLWTVLMQWSRTGGASTLTKIVSEMNFQLLRAVGAP